VKLNPDAEQQELRALIRAFLDRNAPLESTRAVMVSEAGYDTALWGRLVGELGIPALAISEAGGGAGFGMAELALAMEECGAALVPGPLMTSGVVCAQVLDVIGDTQLLPAVVSGEKVAALVRDPVLSVTGSTVTGSARSVAGGDVADVLVVVADDGVYAVDAHGEGVRRQALTTIDLTRREVSVAFEAAPATRLGEPGRVGVGLDRATVALGAESLGVMRRSVEMAVAYAKEREQFGRKIGSFQAVKHGLADMYASLELAAATVAFGAWTADEDPAGLPVASSLVAAYVLPQAFEATFQMIQYHGGIGYTWEHDAHLFYKRAKANETLLGTTGQNLEAIAGFLLGTTPGRTS